MIVYRSLNCLCGRFLHLVMQRRQECSRSLLIASSQYCWLLFHKENDGTLDTQPHFPYDCWLKILHLQKFARKKHDNSKSKAGLQPQDALNCRLQRYSCFLARSKQSSMRSMPKSNNLTFDPTFTWIAHEIGRSAHP